jgi:hypothetical protein
MPENEEVIRLLLELRSEPDPVAFAQKMEVLKGKISETGGSYDILEAKTGEYAVTEGGAALAMDKKVAALNQEVLAQRNLNAMLDESIPAQTVLATHVEDTTKAHGNMGRGVLQASYAVQDFTSVLSGGGGLSRAIGSVQNNIPVLLSGLGLGAGLAGTVSLVSVGLGAAIPLVTKYGEALLGWKQPADEATSAIERLGRAEGEARQKRALAKVDKQIADIEDKMDTEGFISPIDADKLKALRDAAQEVRAREAEEKQMEVQRKADAKRADMLTEEGMHGEDIWRKGMGKEVEERRKQVEHKQKAEDESIIQAADEHDKAKEDGERLAAAAQVMGQQQEARAAKEAERNRIRAEKASAPAAMNRAAQQAEFGEALGMVQQATQGFGPREQAAIARHLQGNHEAGLDLSASFEQAMAYAIAQTRQDIARGIQAGLNRNSQQTQSRMDY